MPVAVCAHPLGVAPELLISSALTILAVGEGIVMATSIGTGPFGFTVYPIGHFGYTPGCALFPLFGRGFRILYYGSPGVRYFTTIAAGKSHFDTLNYFSFGFHGNRWLRVDYLNGEHLVIRHTVNKRVIASALAIRYPYLYRRLALAFSFVIPALM
jgi:hypothetical protein